jgi:hypothetical protein
MVVCGSIHQTQTADGRQLTVSGSKDGCVWKKSSSQQRAESREQREESREQRAESREQGAEISEQTAYREWV